VHRSKALATNSLPGLAETYARGPNRESVIERQGVPWHINPRCESVRHWAEDERSGCASLITIMKSTDLRHCDDPAHVRGLNGSSVRRVLPKRKMTARAVIIVEVASHMPPERGFIHDDYVAQAFAPNGADQGFDVGALPGRPRSRKNLADLHVCRVHPEGESINSVTVPEQVPRRCVPRECLDELRCRPFGSRMLCYVEMHDAPGIMSQDEEHVFCASRRRYRV